MKSILAALLAAAISTSVAHAGDIADRAADAEKALQAGDGAAALEKFRGAEEALWKAMPLAVMNVRQVDSASGFGIYSERANHIYKAGEKVVLYMEPVGYGYGSDGLGNSQIGLSVDLTVLSEAGEKLGTFEKIGSVQVASRSHNRELFFKLDLSLDGLPAGKYRCDFLMHDQNSSKTAPFSTDIEIAG
ncbi:hypothetical protein [Mesorhizobium erdmanii]|uniref:Uncharacterized protein n=1 Tax=Mesorhizobium erdmanii TaxID=1777866 RepID=A0A6M7UFR7_9HYPH|nr:MULTISPECIES: hypothetical protein [Mesorhizobium]OBQ63433.1 hypothetical protein A8146_13335 [Mesorhizobium loti]QKC74990.1 hypothetical protein EB233_05080 [Mesorhizobium erdmanii]